ncbi:methyltransferase domain-containing protein [Pseudotenacibaculum haliotis]|uniref:Methyltransferase domain-containing protein n=1 Tax=Pseudotenacibaculum haliotis TaxID=1862138 RepID=A0ABW5LLU8_9FLAO
MTTNESECQVSKVNYTEHWDKAYTKNPTEKLGWYEEKSTQTLELISKTQLPKDASILHVGAGSSTLIDDMVEEGYTNQIANDLSAKSLQDLEERLGEKSDLVNFIVDDLIKPEKLNTLEGVDLWNDRAVLHFFLKEEEQKAYFDLVRKVVKHNGFVLIAVFALDGAEKCCGLPLQRYNVQMLQDNLGSEFTLQESFDYTFVNPYGGERPYVYALFQRKN